MDGVNRPRSWRQAGRFSWMLVDLPDSVLAEALQAAGFERSRLHEATRRHPELPLAEALLEAGFATEDQLRRAIAKSPAARPAEPPGDRLGPYVLVEHLGSGGAGSVWKGWDTRLSRWVAVKLIRTPQERLRSRFRREAQTLASLSHPNLVAVHEIGASPRGPYLVMEYVEGRPLEAPAGDPERPVRWIADVARAVEYINGRGIIHRDIKPQNILLDARGVPRLVDFGLALDPDAPQLTEPGAVMGTPAFMSPEQARGDSAAASPTTDVYGLGATLYFLCTGRLPFDGRNASEIVARILAGSARPPRQVRADFDPGLEAVILQAMATRPRDRYATAGRLADDLESWLRKEPVLARPPRTAPGPARRLALGAAFLLLLLAVPMTLLRTDRIPPPATSPIGTEDRRRVILDRLRPLELDLQEIRPFFHVQGADIRRRLDRLEDRLTALEPLRTDPDRPPEVPALLGRGWYYAGDPDRAEELFREAEERGSRDPFVPFLLGKIWMERGHLRFVPDFETRDEEFFRDAARRAWSCFERAASGSPHLARIERHLANAYLALRPGSRADVEALCEEGLRRFDGELGLEEYWYLRAMTQTAEQQVGTFTHALEKVRPHWGLGLLCRGRALEQLGRFDEAVRDYRRAVDLCPKVHLYRLQLGNGLARLKDWTGAIASFDEALHLKPGDPMAYVARGSARWRSGQLEAALSDLTEAVRAEPRLLPALVVRANVRRSLKDPPGALADLDQALAIRNSAETRFNRGVVLMDLARFEEAESEFTEAIRLEPRSARSFMSRGAARTKLKRVEQALDDFDRAIALDPSYEKAHFNRGRVLMARGDWRAAADSLSQVVRLNGSDAEALFHRGQCLHRLGDTAGAAADYERALALPAPQPGFHDRVRAALEAARQGRPPAE